MPAYKTLCTLESLSLRFHFAMKNIIKCLKVIFCCLVAKLCPTLCDPMDCSLSGSSVHGISQVRILEWVPSPADLLNPFSGIKLASPVLAGGFFTTKPLGKAVSK